MRNLLLLLPIVLIAGLAIAYITSDYAKTWTWNYKVTVEIDTPDGTKSVSTVRQTQAKVNITKLINSDVKNIIYRTYGEAILIDLGDNGMLFKLIGWDRNELQHVFNSAPSHSQPTEHLKYFSSLKEGTTKTLDGWTSFTYINTNSSKPMYRLDSKDFSNLWDNNIKFKSITYTITKSPVTWKINDKINQIIGKLGNYSRQSLQFKP